ncbi:30S ribosomal protein S6e [Candidatus Pacearchaeota archaeon]|nr:30S ribosomal protein S6e [Candidatus Pacearchaeota archaeon]|tara:strand:+ start:5511 stop:5912 length:402 start_codon:yes stop_codon:yes gene_type:complete
MVFKVNISEKGGKTYKVEVDSEALVGRKIGEVISGNEVSGDLSGYELEIRGTSDKAGFAGKKEEEGPALKKVLLTKGSFLQRVPHKGFRRKKSVRGNTISLDTVQINTFVKKEGEKKLGDVFGKKEESEEKKE